MMSVANASEDPKILAPGAICLVTCFRPISDPHAFEELISPTSNVMVFTHPTIVVAPNEIAFSEDGGMYHRIKVSDVIREGSVEGVEGGPNLCVKTNIGVFMCVGGKIKQLDVARNPMHFSFFFQDKKEKLPPETGHFFYRDEAGTIFNQWGEIIEYEPREVEIGVRNVYRDIMRLSGDLAVY